MISDGFSMQTVVKTMLACAMESLAAIKVACKATGVFKGVRLSIDVSH